MNESSRRKQILSANGGRQSVIEGFLFLTAIITFITSLF
jgi:hypothetical protein